MQYEGEEQIELVMQLIDNELSEPYSIFTYRYGAAWAIAYILNYCGKALMWCRTRLQILPAQLAVAVLPGL